MKKNLYYRTVLQRRNPILDYIVAFFLSIASLPRLLIEVFIRKNFGERYFSTGITVFTIFLMLILPKIASAIADGMFSARANFGGYGEEESGGSEFWGTYLTWYLFTAAFAYFSYLRWKEVRRNPSVFDFERFSLYSGDILPFFWGLKIRKRDPNPRTVQIWLEPLPFFVGGILLWFFGQKIGVLLTVASLCYSISYYAAYKKGDDFVMDKIDEMIMNEENTDAFVDDSDADNARGVRFYARRPTTKELRGRVADSFIEEEKSSPTFAV